MNLWSLCEGRVGSLLLLTALGCGQGGEKAAAPGPTAAADAKVTPAATQTAPAAAPLPFEGDKLASQRFAEAFLGWLRAAQAEGASFEFIEVGEVSNAATAMLEEQRGEGASCRRRWLWLEVMDREEGGGVGAVEARRFGGDCCPGSAGCARTLEGQHQHLLRAVTAKDWGAVAGHVPAGGSVAYIEVTPGERSEAVWSQAKIAAGEALVPGCGPIETTSSCDEAAGADGSFTCRCDGGGYHISYSYRAAATPEGLAPLVEIEAQMD